MSVCISFVRIKNLSGASSFFWLVLISLSSPSRSDEVVLKGPAPSWTRLIDVPAADRARSDQVRNGISWLLADEQIIHRIGGYDEYSRSVYKIVDRPGLEQGAGMNLQFDPSTAQGHPQPFAHHPRWRGSRPAGRHQIRHFPAGEGRREGPVSTAG